MSEAQKNPAPLKIVAGANMKALINSNLNGIVPAKPKVPPAKTPAKAPLPVPLAAKAIKAPVLAKAQKNMKEQPKLSATMPTKNIQKIESEDNESASKIDLTPNLKPVSNSDPKPIPKQIAKPAKVVEDSDEEVESSSESIKKILKKNTPVPKKTTDKLDYSDDSSDIKNKTKKTAKDDDSESDEKNKSDASMSNSSGMGLKNNSNLRGPGRPRKNPQIDDLPTQGVVDKPESDKNKMEMRYGNPASLKKIFMLLKAMDPEELHIYFEKDKFTIKARDHLEKSNVYVEAYGKNMNKYYCEKPFAISLESEAIAKIFQTMDNTHHAIQFISRKRAGDDINLYIIMIDRVRNRHDNYEIKVKGGSAFKGLDKEVNCKNYPIQFTLESKDFKKTISKIALHTDKFTIQKKGNEDLRISTQQSKKTGVKCNFVYKDAEDIKLKSKIGKNDLFSVAINIKYIKNIAKAQLGDEICIHADSFKPTISEIVLDYNEAHKNYTFRIVISTETFKYKAIKD